MSLGGIVADVAGSILGKEESYSTNLKDFLKKFSDSSGKYVNQLNPFNTFEIKFSFEPTYSPEKDNKGFLGGLVDSLVGSAMGAAKDAVSNMTGGLLDSLFNDENGVIKAHDEFNREPSTGSMSFMHYLAAANLLVGGENEWFGAAGQAPNPLEIQLGYYVQSITIPQIKMPEGKKMVTQIGEFITNGQYIIPDSNQLQMTILNTRLPLIERIFYPWMREVTLPYWSYKSQPYTTATITVDFSKHTDMQYVFCGCRPCQIESLQANQANDQNFQRTVTFLFDFMFITSKLTTMPSTTDRLVGALGDIGNSIGDSIGF